MIRACTCSLILVTAYSCYSQPVTVQPSSIPGIDIVGPQSSEFAAAVPEILGIDMSGLPPGMSPWLPYAVLVRNNSSEPLAGMCIVYAATPTVFLDRGPGPCALWFTSPYGISPAGARSFRLQPGKAVLVFPHFILKEPGDINPRRVPADEKWLSSLPNYQRAKRLTISLDDVVFASGQFMGPDIATEYPRFQSILTAPRAVATTLLEKKASAKIADILTWLLTLAPQASIMDPPAYYKFQSGAEAREMLKVYYDKGEAALYSSAATTLEEPVFPLHQ
jgi:hypothetical protein